MTLSSASALQAKTGSASTQTANVVLDAGTTAGSTVTVEIAAGGLPITDGGMSTRIPSGFEQDAAGVALTLKRLFVFRKRDVAADEGVSGSTSWDFSYTGGAGAPWTWRVTEWDQTLEPVYPLERISMAETNGTAPTNLAIAAPTAAPTRDDLVGLAWHNFLGGSGTPTMNWQNHTNSFTVRDAQQVVLGSSNVSDSWSWKFGVAADTWACTADINFPGGSGVRVPGDTFTGLLVLYAGTTYA